MWLAGNRGLFSSIGVAVVVAYTFAALGAVFMVRSGRALQATWALIITALVVFVIGTAMISDLAPSLAAGLAFGTVLMAVINMPHDGRAWIAGSVAVLGALGLLVLDFVIDLIAPWRRDVLPDITTGVLLPSLVVSQLIVMAIVVIARMPGYGLGVKLLTSIAGLATGPLFLGSLVNNYQSDLALRNAANLALYTSALQTASAIDGFFNSNLSAVSAEARLSQITDYLRLPSETRAEPLFSEPVLAALESWRRTALAGVEIAEARPFMRDFLLLDQNGSVLLSTQPDHAFLAGNIAEAAAQNDIVLARGVYFQPDGRGWLYFFAPVPSIDAQTGLPGSPAGVLVAMVEATWIDRLLARNNDLLGPGSQSWAMLYDENTLQLASGLPGDGRSLSFVVRPDPDLLRTFQEQGRAPRGVDPAATDLDELYLSLQVSRSLQGQATYYAGPIATEPNEPRFLVALTRISGAPWTLAYAQPERVALFPVRNQIRFIVGLAILFGAMVAVGGMVAARRITRPVRALTAVARAVTGGALDARATDLPRDERGELAQAFNTMTAQLQGTLTELDLRVQRRTAQLQATAEISRLISTILDVDLLRASAVDLINTRFGFYHTSLYILSGDHDTLDLRATAGHAADTRLARGQQVPTGAYSLVGWVAQTRQARAAGRDSAEAVLFDRDPLLPGAMASFAAPLVAGDSLIGVLEMFSDDPEAFTPTDQHALGTLADQLAVSLRNADSFQQTRVSLAEAEARYRSTLTANWSRWSAESPSLPDLEFSTGAVQEEPISIPIRLRDQDLGAIDLYLPIDAPPLGSQEHAALETAAAQLAIALESATLVRESQARSQHERLIVSITDQMRTSLSPEAILQNGIRQLGLALGGAAVTVRLKPDAARERDATAPASVSGDKTDLGQAQDAAGEGEA
jgi:GAF domain-containing protein/HAMP domain-containing protein